MIYHHWHKPAFLSFSSARSVWHLFKFSINGCHKWECSHGAVAPGYKWAPAIWHLSCTGSFLTLNCQLLRNSAFLPWPEDWYCSLLVYFYAFLCIHLCWYCVLSTQNFQISRYYGTSQAHHHSKEPQLRGAFLAVYKATFAFSLHYISVIFQGSFSLKEQILYLSFFPETLHWFKGMHGLL